MFWWDHTRFVQRTIQNDFIKVFQIIQCWEYFRLKGWNISCRRRNLYLRALKEDSGRFQSGLTWNSTETSLPSNPFLGIAVSVGQIWEDDRCKKIIVFSFDLDSFWLLLSLVTGRFFKGGEARIFEMVSYCEMLSWMISGFSSWASPDHRSSDYEFLPIPPKSLFHSHQVLKRPLWQFLSLLLLRKLCRNCSKSLPFSVAHISFIKDVNLCGTHIYGSWSKGGWSEVISGSDILIVICEASLRHSWPRLPFFYDCISGISLRCNQRCQSM